MQNLIGGSSPFRADDKFLLKTRMFSDCQLKLGDRVWDVHKSIVCVRSDFLDNRFEAKADVFEVSLCTEKQVELFLEYVYSGDIETIADFSLADCVELWVVATKFIVPSMSKYSKKVLWDKLKHILQAISTILPTGDAHHHQNAIDASLDQLSFHQHFTDAVEKAYNNSDIGSQLILADFVWAGRAWLIAHPIIEELNVKYPKFGNLILTALNKGPQSFVARADGKLSSDACAPPGTLCANCARAQVERPSQGMENFDS